ncbi:hypothetical protein LET1_00010 [Pectobacterium phage LET1]|nr:hypothetical protein LET1_00010 [Pectobacterium phage LET1]
MFKNSLTDDMMLQAAIRDCRDAGLVVTMVALFETHQILILVKEANGFPLTSGTFDMFNETGALNFLVNTHNDYRSWK